VERALVDGWMAGYEEAWRSAGTASLRQLFAPDIEYLASPWRAPVRGLAALGRFWEAARDGPDERFTLSWRVVAVDGRTAVVRVEVDYAASGHRWRDLWVLSFDADGRCTAFEEWPFAPEQPDGQ
jgi:hypothetical protein